MNRICIEKSTNKLIEFQTGNAPLGTLSENAIAAGYLKADIEEFYTPLDSEAAMLAHESTADNMARLKKEANATQRAQDMIDNLPDWQTVNDNIDAITNMAEAKAFIKKLARVVYWLAKNSSD